MNVNGPSYAGQTVFDLSNVAGILIDLAPRAMRGLRAAQPGLEGVFAELATAIPAHAEDADIPPKAHPRLLSRQKQMTALDAHELALMKALEVVRETRAKMENDQEDDISLIAKAAQRAADKADDPAVAAPFEKTIAYMRQTADKGLATKKKKEAEAKADAEAKAKAEAEAEAKAKAGEPAPRLEK